MLPPNLLLLITGLLWAQRASDVIVLADGDGVAQPWRRSTIAPKAMTRGSLLSRQTR